MQSNQSHLRAIWSTVFQSNATPIVSALACSSALLYPDMYFYLSENIFLLSRIPILPNVSLWHVLEIYTFNYLMIYMNMFAYTLNIKDTRDPEHLAEYFYSIPIQHIVWIQQGSLYYQPKQCIIIGKSLKNCHTFVLFDSPNMGNLMTPV